MVGGVWVVWWGSVGDMVGGVGDMVGECGRHGGGVWETW